MTFDGICERGGVQRAPQEIEERSPARGGVYSAVRGCMFWPGGGAAAVSFVVALSGAGGGCFCGVVFPGAQPNGPGPGRWPVVMSSSSAVRAVSAYPRVPMREREGGGGQLGDGWSTQIASSRHRLVDMPCVATGHHRRARSWSCLLWCCGGMRGGGCRA
jgi:hypothetical protein